PSAVRLALGDGDAWRRTGAGVLTGLAVLLTHSAALLAPLLALVVLARDGARNAAAFVLGGLPLVAVLGAYDAWLFGAPWRTSYSAVTGLSTRFAAPKAAIVADFVVGPRGGLFLYSPFLLAAPSGLAAAWRGVRRAEAALTVAFLLLLTLVGASWQSQFADRASWSHGLGARYLFPALPLLAAFTGAALERASRRALLMLAVPSLVCAYLGAQAGFAPVPNALPYALKTFVSGTGMGVLFKEALPAWTGLETLHTVVARPGPRRGHRAADPRRARAVVACRRRRRGEPAVRARSLPRSRPRAARDALHPDRRDLPYAARPQQTALGRPRALAPDERHPGRRRQRGSHRDGPAPAALGRAAHDRDPDRIQHPDRVARRHRRDARVARRLAAGAAARALRTRLPGQ